MTDILDAIELELVGAVRRHNAGARRRRIKAAAGAAVAALTLGGATVTATIVDPLDALFPSGAPDAVLPSASVRSSVTVRDDAGVGWDVEAYRSRGDSLATVILERPRPAGAPAVGYSAGLLLAIGEQRGAQVGAGTDVVARDGRVHVVVGGTVAGSTASVAVTIAGERHEATVADTAVTVPVALDPAGGASAELRRQLDELPDTIARRAFAVALPSTSAPAPQARVAATFELTFGDGHVTREQRTICVSPRCAGD